MASSSLDCSTLTAAVSKSIIPLAKQGYIDSVKRLVFKVQGLGVRVCWLASRNKERVTMM